MEHLIYINELIHSVFCVGTTAAAATYGCELESEVRTVETRREMGN